MSSNTASLVQSLSGIPNWVALTGGVAMGKVASGQSTSMDVSNAEDVTSVEYGLCAEAVVSCGPWGGQGGTQFYDGRGDIVEIVLTYTDEHITCVQSSYNQAGTNFKTSAHGTPMKGQTSTIALSWPDEYLVQVKGTTNLAQVERITGSNDPFGVVVSSLTFITNKRVYGPYGKESGQRFESLPGGKVVGFFGKSGTLLDQIGVLTQHSMTEVEAAQTLLASADKVKNVFDYEQSDRTGSSSVIVEGPWGGVGGKAFHDGNGRVVEIIVTFQQNQISSFQATYEHGGVQFQGSLHGIESGTRTKITLKPSEYLVQVKGTAGKIFGSEAITSLIFVTNQRIFGPYGCFTGRAFESSAGCREVSGFFGRCGSQLDQVGVITKFALHNQNTTVVSIQGPWGGPHGLQFCSGTGDLEDIYVTFNKSHIVALQVAYNLGSKVDSMRSDCWGGDIGEIVKITLHPRGEFVIQLKGTTDVIHNGTHVVTSLTFVTNQQSYGPYGRIVGNCFESTPGKVVGFYGRSEYFLHEIGIMTEPLSESNYNGGPKSFVKPNDLANEISRNTFEAKSSESQDSIIKMKSNAKQRNSIIVNQDDRMKWGSHNRGDSKTTQSIATTDLTNKTHTNKTEHESQVNTRDEQYLRNLGKVKKEVGRIEGLFGEQFAPEIYFDHGMGNVLDTENGCIAHKESTIDKGAMALTLDHGNDGATTNKTYKSGVNISNTSLKLRNDNVEQKDQDTTSKGFSLRILEKVKKEVAHSERLLGALATVKVQIDYGTGHVDTAHVCIADKESAIDKGIVASTLVCGSHDIATATKIDEKVDVSNLTSKVRTVESKTDNKNQDTTRREFSSRILEKIKKEVVRSEGLLGTHAAVKVQIDHGTGHMDT